MDDQPTAELSATHSRGVSSAPAERCIPVPNRAWLYRLLICIVTLSLWGHSIGFEFVWDDDQFIRDLQSIRSLKNVPAMFTALEAQSSFPQGFVLFRPLRTLHYALLCALGREGLPEPWLYHLSNVLWHTGAALLLFSVAAILLRKDGSGNSDRIAFWMALAFAVHPVVTEVVCWAKSLDDAMATVFILAATRALLLYDRSNRQDLWACFYFLLAVYSKESAVPFVLIAFALFRIVHRLTWRENAWRSAPFLLVAALFVIHRHLVIGRTTQTAPISGSYLQTLIDMFPVVPKYLRLLCGLPPFCIDYSYLPRHGVFTAPVLIGVLLLIGLAGTCAWAFGRDRYQILALGLFWMAAFILPVSNLVPMMQYMAERFLYLPLIGWLLLLGWLGSHLRQKHLQRMAPIGALVVWALLSWQRSFIWKDELTLFEQSSLEGPRTPRVEENAVAAIFHLPEVRALFRLDKATHTVTSVGPVTPEKAGLAVQKLTEGARLFPTDENLVTALGIMHAALGHTNDALACFETVVRHRTNDAKYWNNLAMASLDVGNVQRAQEAIEQGLAIDPKSVNVLRSASRLYWQNGDFSAALVVLKRLQEQEPNNPEHGYWIQRATQKLATSSSR